MLPALKDIRPMDCMNGEDKTICYQEEIIYSRIKMEPMVSEEHLTNEVPSPDLEEARHNCGVLAIISVLQNYEETARRMSEMIDVLMFRRKLYTDFRKRLASASKSDVELILAGSLSQRLAALHFIYPSKESGLYGRKADVDIDVVVVDKSNRVTQRFKPGRYFTIQPTEHTGYVRLYKGTPHKSKCISSRGFRKYWKKIIDKTELFTRFTGRGSRFPRRGDAVSGPAITKVENLPSRDFFDHDFVPAIQCIEWPLLAREWISRKRSSGWPSKQLLNACVSSKCHVVPVGCKESVRFEKNKEWRLSFTESEVKLSRSFTESQRQSYIATKMLIKTAVNLRRNKSTHLKQAHLITSYDVKTTMFWLCESRTDWNDLIANVKAIIVSLIGYFQAGFLPDYFIPTKNLFSSVCHDMLCSAEEILKETISLPVYLFKTCFYEAYSSCFQYDLDFSPFLRKLYKEIGDFKESGLPSRRLICFSILRILVEISSLIVNEYDAKDLDKSINVMIDALNDLHFRFVTAFGVIKLFTSEDLSKISKPEEIYEKLSIIHEIFINTVSSPAVLSILGKDVFAILSAFLSGNVPAASYGYGARAEVVDFAELLQQNMDNEYLIKLAEDAYGSVDNLLKQAADLEDAVADMHEILSLTAETALTAYHNVVNATGLTEYTDFACLEEKVIVYSCKNLEKYLSGIFEEDSLGNLSSRERLALLRGKLKRSDIRMQIG